MRVLTLSLTLVLDFIKARQAEIQHDIDTDEILLDSLAQTAAGREMGSEIAMSRLSSPNFNPHRNSNANPGSGEESNARALSARWTPRRSL